MPQLKPALKGPWPGSPETRDREATSVSPEATGANPFFQIAVAAEGNRRAAGPKGFKETLGATPPRDGPWKPSATELARLLPPKARLKRREAL